MSTRGGSGPENSPYAPPVGIRVVCAVCVVLILVSLFFSFYLFVETVEAFVFGGAHSFGSDVVLLLALSSATIYTIGAVLATYGLWHLEPWGWTMAALLFAFTAVGHAVAREFVAVLVWTGITLYVVFKRHLFRED